jgi:glucose-specific phosphotransferase system IIA component
MFGFFKKKKEINLLSPVDGEVVDLESVPDEVFSQGLVGEGVAIIPSSNIISSPIDGVILRLFPTNHAFSISDEKGLDIMVHIGLDTVELYGQGFKALKEDGQRVEAGTPIISVDLEYIKSMGKNIITPVVINGEKNITIKDIKKGYIKRGEPILKMS